MLGVEPEPPHGFQAEVDALLRVAASPAPPDKEIVSGGLDDLEVKILELLSKLPTTEAFDARSLASQVGLTEQRAEFHLRRLVACDFACDSFRIGRPVEYFIGQKGRGALIERGSL